MKNLYKFKGILSGAAAVIAALSTPESIVSLPPDLAKVIIVAGTAIAVFSSPPIKKP